MKIIVTFKSTTCDRKPFFISFVFLRFKNISYFFNLCFSSFFFFTFSQLPKNLLFVLICPLSLLLSCFFSLFLSSFSVSVDIFWFHWFDLIANREHSLCIFFILIQVRQILKPTRSNVYICVWSRLPKNPPAGITNVKFVAIKSLHFKTFCFCLWRTWNEAIL